MRKKYYFDGIETNYEVTDDGHVYNSKTQRELKGTTKRNEYRSVQITLPDKKLKSLMIHRMVAETFLPNPDNLPMVDHIDRDPLNNVVTNLRWVSAAENMRNRNLENCKGVPDTDNYIVDLKDWKPLSFNDNYVANKETGEIGNQKTLRVLKGSSRNGYLRVTIEEKNILFID